MHVGSLWHLIADAFKIISALRMITSDAQA